MAVKLINPVFKSIENLKARLAKVGATVDEYSEFFCCDAPSGYVWKCNDCRCITVQFANRSESWLAEAMRRDCLPEVEQGLVLVEDAEEIKMHKWDTGEDDWGAPAGSPKFLAIPK